jgi:hypothetical protein
VFVKFIFDSAIYQVKLLLGAAADDAATKIAVQHDAGG